MAVFSGSGTLGVRYLKVIPVKQGTRPAKGDNNPPLPRAPLGLVPALAYSH